ncbi:MAG: sugar transferase [Clostridiales bacterium]|nr:sugar transferase [Clostridiales bacterium]
MYSQSSAKTNKTNQGRFYLTVKRLLDFVLSLIGIVVLMPVFIIIGILIKVDSRGPVIFKQKRYGKDKEPFYIYKFRTMASDAPQNVATKDLNDSKKYITKIGAFLRRTSLDELPQLFNILLGQMTIVGPRPVVLKEENLIIARDLYGANDIKPGITGWAQINGRDLLSIEEKAKLDGYYVENMGFKMDIKCFFKTVKYVLKGEGILEGGDEIDINHI